MSPIKYSPNKVLQISESVLIERGHSSAMRRSRMESTSPMKSTSPLTSVKSAKKAKEEYSNVSFSGSNLGKIEPNADLQLVIEN